MNKKREGSSLVPYKRVGGEIFFFLQKRDKNAVRAPGLFGIFGGGFEEGEDAQMALVREIKEELNYVPKTAIYFSRYEFAMGIFHVFIEEVGGGFETEVKVDEGEYGKFLTLSDIETMPNVSPSTRAIVNQLSEFLTQTS
ncbi:MAG: NUDIX domain-containing protein [Minisyncoccia bacterium]